MSDDGKATTGSSAVELAALAPQPARPAFADFYATRYPSAVRLAWLLTGDAGTSEDVVQDAFARLHERWAHVEDPPAYLRATVVNACRDRHRRREREERRLRVVSAGTSASIDLVSGAEDLALIDAVRRLGLRQRTAVVLRYWGDLSDVDIAAALGVAPATVRSLLARALTRLRKETLR